MIFIRVMLGFIAEKILPRMKKISIPTGQGTGLGLSLAFDTITKGHGEEIKVETKEG
jgi:signal transduction histidine kinase